VHSETDLVHSVDGSEVVSWGLGSAGEVERVLNLEGRIGGKDLAEIGLGSIESEVGEVGH